MTQTPDDIQTNGFPAGYFVIRSIASNRLLDVTMDEIEDGTEIALWPEKESSLVETRRDPGSNNQVFFIDTSGALCARSAGHAIDIEGNRLVLRHRRPVSHPFPNSYAHPLPRFIYTQETAEITVEFAADPSYPPPAASSSNAWRNKTYVLASVPLRKPRTIIDDASAFISSTIASPIASFFSGRSPVQEATLEDVSSSHIDLADHEVLEEERGEEAEVDDSPDAGRKVRMLAVTEKSRNDNSLGEKARDRRRWQVVPLRRSDARTGAM